MNALVCLLCGVYFEFGVSAHHAVTNAIDRHYLYWKYDINETKNPYGIVAIGYEWEQSNRIKWSVALRHESSIATTQDHGSDSVVLNMRFKPWAQ